MLGASADSGTGSRVLQAYAFDIAKRAGEKKTETKERMDRKKRVRQCDKAFEREPRGRLATDLSILPG